MKNKWFKNIIDSVAERGRELLGLDNDESNKQNIHTLCKQLLSGRGEASGIALSQEILHLYSNMPDEEKLIFFQMLAQEFDPNIDQLQTAMNKYLESNSAEDLIKLNTAVEAPRQELFRRLNMAPHGTASLVGLRADLLRVLKVNPALKSVDADLKHLFSSWFNRGFLQLHSIDWRSPAHILEKLINYESVHEIHGWNDLRRRLMKDRRCFAFFHPAMPEEPLIFIEIAFVQGLSKEVASLIDPKAPELDPKLADSAIFYSINNTQVGLRGISFGNFLIKQVLTECADEFPWVKISSTLSPIPSFASSIRKWLKGESHKENTHIFDEILQKHRELLEQLSTKHGLDSMKSDKELLETLLDTQLNRDNNELSVILCDLALVYLTHPDKNGKLADPVAMFHLSNGARLEHINTFADMSPHGMSTSYGMMVNYLYDMKDVESNHEAFVSNGQVMLSDALRVKIRKLKNRKIMERSSL